MTRVHAGRRPLLVGRGVLERRVDVRRDRPQRLDADRAGAQHARRLALDVHDGRLDPRVTRPAVEHEIDTFPELLDHVRRGRRREALVTIRARGGDRLSERGEKRARDGM